VCFRRRRYLAAHQDQFAYLAAAEILSTLRVEEVAEQLGRVPAGSASSDAALPARPRRG